jgi:transaldolase/glucose-6-phosphate isomerase
MTNPLLELQRLGQSPWHDNIRRELLTSGALARMVADGDITGLTSNPTIFEHAIQSGTEYQDQIRSLARAGKRPDEIFDALAIADIRDAADVFAAVYRRAEGADGFVSIEVAPVFANDTAKTIAEAHRLWAAVARPNLMVKIPATREGVPAIEECIAAGLNINVTLIFSLQRYDEVMNAYLAGIARRVAAGKAVHAVASVASFFVSRVDTEVDKRLDALIASAAAERIEHLKALQGRSAIANAKLAYRRFREKFGTSRFTELARHGARVQRPLWASTSTKNPAYPDVYYVEALIGPDTVDTMPPATIIAYKDHGHPAVRIDRDVDDAQAILQRLAVAGVTMDDVTMKLEIDGVASFAKSYESLLATVGAAAAAAGPARAPARARKSSASGAKSRRAATKMKRPAAKRKATVGAKGKRAKTRTPTKRAKAPVRATGAGRRKAPRATKSAITRGKHAKRGGRAATGARARAGRGRATTKKPRRAARKTPRRRGR